MSRLPLIAREGSMTIDRWPSMAANDGTPGLPEEGRSERWHYVSYQGGRAGREEADHGAKAVISWSGREPSEMHLRSVKGTRNSIIVKPSASSVKLQVQVTDFVA